MDKRLIVERPTWIILGTALVISLIITAIIVATDTRGLTPENARLGLIIFCGLALTGFAVAWTMRRPLVRLAERLQALTGTAKRPAHQDLDASLTALGERLTRSEDRARQASETLRNARDDARLRADIIAGMSHELRAPLTAIVGHTEIMAGGRLDREQREHIGTIRKSAVNLLNVIENVLEWGSLEADRASLDEAAFNLAEVIEDTVALLAPTAFEKGLELVHLTYQDVPLQLRGDPLRLQQILTNLIANAIKFTDNGSVVVRAMREDEDQDSVSLRISITDTGPGIEPSQRGQLFGRYGRSPGNVRGEGSGLGLAISKRLLEMMGGQIDVDSVPGEGSEFYFTLPLQKALHHEPQALASSDLTDKRVCLCEPFPVARNALRHRLEAWHMEVVAIDSHAACRDSLEADPPTAPPPDILILGLLADQAGGPDIAAILSAARTAEIPTLTLINSFDSGLHTQLQAAGAARSLPKSLDRLQLYAELSQLAGVVPQRAQALPLDGIAALIADDDASNRRYLAALLTDLGARVTTVAGGDAAIAAWRDSGFPLIVLDERMPGTSGLAAAAGIRANPTDGVRPVIVGVTAAGSGDAAKRFRQAGADTCLIKPFDGAQLMRRLAPLLAGAPERAAASHRRLATDPHMAALLVKELPVQIRAVTTALADDDWTRSREAAHTVHGTAAFYDLDALQAQAAALERELAAGEPASKQAAARLTVAAEQALVTLERRAGQRVAEGHERTEDRSGNQISGIS